MYAVNGPFKDLTVDFRDIQGLSLGTRKMSGDFTESTLRPLTFYNDFEFISNFVLIALIPATTPLTSLLVPASSNLLTWPLFSHSKPAIQIFLYFLEICFNFLKQA